MNIIGCKWNLGTEVLDVQAKVIYHIYFKFTFATRMDDKMSLATGFILDFRILTIFN